MDTLNALRAQAFDVTRQLVEEYRAMRQQDPEIARHLGSMASLMDQLEPIVQQWQSIGDSLVSDQPPTSTTKPHGGTEGKLMSSASNWVKSQCKFAQAMPPAGQPPMEAPAPAPAPQDDYAAKWKAQQEQRRQQTEAHQNAYHQKFQAGQPFNPQAAHGLESSTIELDPEEDPKYHGPQGEQAYLADGQPYPLKATVHYEAEWQPSEGDGWNEPRTNEGWMIQIHHIVTQDGRDITGYFTPRALEHLEEKLGEQQGHPRDRYAGSLSWYKSAKEKKKKHKSCKSCGGWVGYWMAACPGCGDDHSEGSEGDSGGDSAGNGNSVSSAPTGS
jgi:hypothetical protein